MPRALPGNGLPANHERERGVLQVAGEVWRDALSGFCFAKPFSVKDASLIRQMKAMEDGNRRLKPMYADLSMLNDLLKEAL